MFLKYSKTYRIRVPQFDVKGKFMLSGADTQSLLSGQVVIQEKLDGANVAVIGTKQEPGWRLQKRGSLLGPGDHEQFNYFVNWAHKNFEKMKQVPEGWVVYGELMYAQHNIYYDKLPSYFLVFDIWNGDKFLGPMELTGFCQRVGLHHVPILYYGPAPARTDLVKYIPENSMYGTGRSEGIVVKNWKKQLKGKIVRPEFMKEVDESDHWMEKSVVKNKLTDPQTAISYILNR